MTDRDPIIPQSPASCPPPLSEEPSSTEGNEPAGRNALADLLKAPLSVVRRIQDDKALPQLAAQFLFWGLVFHGIYGFAMGLFDSSGAGLMTAGKAPLIALFSLLLCLPSLYVFSCVSGMSISVTQALALAGSILAMTGLLLLALTPVTWLFSVSTSSLPFMVVVNMLAWCIAVGFALRFVGIMTRYRNAKTASGLKWWLFIYIVVSLQMTTTLRPLLSRSETGWRSTEKKFFLAHFKDSLVNPQKGRAPAKGR